ncbi:MAG: class I SAM-dependent methyltransferase [Gammaproteobacteria bacterium]|nr:class I SAM-dependent methyltransferase [Gammaproteobacteria bacterium]
MRSEDEMIAYALETHTALLPYLPELLADLEELGGNAEAITSVLDDLNLTKSTTVVDLGCGKGAVAVKVAQGLNLNVLGIDLFEPFIESCKELAERQDVSGLCHFIHGDILKLLGKIEPRDVAIFAALGDVLGPLDQTVSVIRQYVKPGGYMVISDGFIKDGGSSDFPGFEQYAEHTDMIARLTACGDTLVREVIVADIIDRGEDEMIATRAKVIAARRPEIADEILTYAEMQAAEYEYIDKNFVSAIWVLKRSL